MLIPVEQIWVTISDLLILNSTIFFSFSNKIISWMVIRQKGVFSICYRNLLGYILPLHTWLARFSECIHVCSCHIDISIGRRTSVLPEKKKRILLVKATQQWYSTKKNNLKRYSMYLRVSRPTITSSRQAFHRARIGIPQPVLHCYFSWSEALFFFLRFKKPGQTPLTDIKTFTLNHHNTQ